MSNEFVELQENSQAGALRELELAGLASDDFKVVPSVEVELGKGVRLTLKRRGNYWVARLNRDLPYENALALNEGWGTVVRARGAAVGDLKQNESVRLWDIDTQEGLKALLAALKSYFCQEVAPV